MCTFGTAGGVNPKSNVKLSVVPTTTVVPAPLCEVSFSELSSGTALSSEPAVGTVPDGVPTVTV